MPASEAQILANQRNAQKSTGPKTVEGKERSRANSYKNGQTGSGIVLPEEDRAEVQRRAKVYGTELNAEGEVGHLFVRLFALASMRIERGADQQTAALAERIRQVQADFVAPEDADDAEAAKLLDDAIRRAMFDPSKEAMLARKYEAANQRILFRCLKELQLRAKAAKVDQPSFKDQALMEEMASIFQRELEARMPIAEITPQPPRVTPTEPKPKMRDTKITPQPPKVTSPPKPTLSARDQRLENLMNIPDTKFYWQEAKC